MTDFVNITVENRWPEHSNLLKKNLMLNLLKYMKVNRALLTSKIKNDKLNNNVLRVRTGKLRNSIKGKTTKNLSAVSAIAYTQSPYAAIHEYGFNGAEAVKSYNRIHKSNSARMSKIMGKSWESYSIVKAHTRQMKMPKRSYMRTSLADLKKQLIDNISKGIAETVSNPFQNRSESE